MTTDELTRQLSADAHPVQPRSVQRVVWPALALGTLASIGIASLCMVLLPNLLAANHGGQVFTRAALALAFGGVGLAVLLASLRPGTDPSWMGRSVSVISLLLLGLLAIELPTIAAARLMDALTFPKLVRSPLMITALSIPVFVALVAVVRAEAPTRLNLTGAALGLTSGGIGAAAFFLAGPDSTATPLSSWYAMGIGLALLGGLFLGPRLLRW